ncbi:FMRFamide receptor-like [Ruditapes philippinarum]|uniref:FMRFamide receptor-like n=1 Tax=Ruditapes philippinarum TaxID=129788 RepID=UPI00295AAC90|nr:FMRFamide receptor-like [Ruditapes philippinarum]
MNVTEKTLEDFRQYNIGNFLWIYVSPILIIVGTFGNILSICVLLRPKLRCSTTMFYLTCLSFGDLFTLYTGLLRYWISKAFDVDVRHFSNATCKIHAFLVYLSLDFTVWILVSVTIDRCLRVSMPFKAKIICTLKRSRYVIAVILFLLVIKNMHFLWNLQLVDTSECDAKTEAVSNLLKYVWPWIDFSTFCLIPFSIMIACNIKIIYRIIRSQKKLNKHKDYYRTPTLKPKHDSPLSQDNSSEKSVQSTSMMSQMTSHQTSQQTSRVKKRSSARRISSLTAMLLTVNCVFLLTTSPIQAFLIGKEYWYSDKTPEEKIAWCNFWRAVVNMLQYTNNAVHFFLYCLTGPIFRNELKTMLLDIVKGQSGGTKV